MSWKHIEHTEEELKTIVKDVYDGKIFTSLHLSEDDQHLVTSVFMPLLFLGAAPSFPLSTKNIKKDRKNKLIYMEEYQKWCDETQEREEFMKNIGMVYEENSEAVRSINGYPMFMSLKIVSQVDTKRFIEMYNKYVKMREEFEKNW
jgi:hypothetical protein